ncbi:FecR domain-containing protein [Acinetobacter sp. S40]|uniref:FecR domain-containing protein n=1 Tax=unclassified Acinetobacter TaxID=196816 RepID=UPI00190B61B4|nr:MULTISPECIES: FecR domain-containing protein [unclassified Acinetobacter]MBJ9985376.1 FecR domain-containing protein [Acinetobacter sp. S40]MBK0063726.1 FecR domain-containing protein [Acinetobacter sp. S55]MBK0066985.1 FecR domain-containing protein [Acinetobacter sp. S54]
MSNKSIFPENSSHISIEISQQATEWFVRLQADDISEQELSEFQDWLKQDQSHQYAWQCLEQFGFSLANIKHPLLHQAIVAVEQKDKSLWQYSLKSIIWLLVFGTSMLGLYQAEQHQLWQQWQADYKTEVGEQRQIRLADGSQIILNTNTAINIDYNTSKRKIELIKGEIQIVVGHDAQHRPFLVQGRDGMMQDVGTHFDIRQNDQNTVVAVTEGEVQITTLKSKEKTNLLANQQVLFNQQTIQPIEPLHSKYSSWSSGTLNVYKMPLTEFITELDRYHRGKLRYDHNIAGLEVSGVFPVQDSEKVLHSLEQQLPIKVESEFYYWKKISLKEN